MKFTKVLGKSLLPVIGGILLGTYVGSLFLAAFLRMGDGPALQRWLHVPVDALGLSVFALLAVTPAALLFAWPAYAFLLHRNRATWLTVTVMPLVPAALLWLLDGPEIGGLLALYGLCIVWIAHALQLRFVRVVEMSRSA